jgi:hypothetical protein
LDTLSGLVSPSKSIAMVSVPCYWSKNSEVIEPKENYCVLCVKADVLYTNTLKTSSDLESSFVIHHWVTSSLIPFPLLKLLNIKANVYKELEIILKN